MTFEWQDAINGGIELIGAAAVLASAHRVWRDRGARGVHPTHVGYTLGVNFWSVYYYYHIQQPISFWCGVVFCGAVSLWSALIWTHRKGDYDDRTG